MMLYQEKSLIRPSFLQRVFKQQPIENALLEVNNLLANQLLPMITKEQIDQIGDKYGIVLMDEFRLNIEEFYAVLLNSLLQDFKLELGSRKKLEHLKFILSLNDKQVTFLTSEIGAIAYEKCYVRALTDGRLSDGEKQQLDLLELHLQLSLKKVTEISDRVRTNYASQYFTRLIQSNRISPRDEEEWKLLCQNLNIIPNQDLKTKQLFNNGKLYWSLENAPLPVLQPLIGLQKSEVCHLHIQHVSWYEERSLRSKYGGTYSKLINSGPIYLTGKRLLHYGSDRAHAIKLEDIIRLQETGDGLTIHKLTGKSPTLKMPTHEIQILSIILQRLASLRY